MIFLPFLSPLQFLPTMQVHHNARFPMSLLSSVARAAIRHVQVHLLLILNFMLILIVKLCNVNKGAAMQTFQEQHIILQVQLTVYMAQGHRGAEFVEFLFHKPPGTSKG